MSIIQGNAKQASTRGFYSFPIEQSLRFNDDDSAYLEWTPASAGNRKTWTWSGWVKLGNTFTTERVLFAAGSSASDTGFGQILLANDATIRVNAYFQTWRGTTAKLRDPSSWYHIVVQFDTTQATAADRVKVYINGVQQTAFDYNNNPTQNTDYAINQSATHYIGRIDAAIGTGYLDGYLAEVNFIDGTALGPTSFGETKNGVWIPKDPTGLTYGTNGFRLSFADDAEVQAFNTVLHGGTGATQSVTGTGFSPDFVWSKARSGDTVGGHLLFDTVRGPTKYLQSNGTGAEATDSTMLTSFDSDGFTLGSSQYINDSGNEKYVAWCWDAGANSDKTYAVTVVSDGGNKYRFDGYGTSAVTLELAEGSTYRFDQSDSSNSGHPLRFSTTSNGTHGGGSEYTTGVTTNGTPGSAGAYTEITVASGAPTLYYYCTVHSGMGGQANTNTTEGASNFDGSIQSVVKANTTTGFSIVSYTGNGSAGATIGHSLGAVPSWIIVKNRGTSGTENRGWTIYHSALGATKYLEFSDGMEQTGTNRWNDTAPTSSVFTVGDGSNGNENGDSHIAYCWSQVSGYSSFGSYTGNASSVSVTTGFLPAIIFIKRYNTSAANTNWEIHDNTRNTAGELLGVLYPNTSGAEGFNNSGSSITTNSTSFTVNGSGGSINGNNDTYIYAAFADTREAAFWLDQSGNDNDWQPVNLDHNDTVADSPTDNFATLNPLAKGPNNVLSEGNLQVVHGGTGGWQQCQSTFAFPESGKWYCEFTIVYQGTATDRVGINVSKVGYGPINTSTNLSGGNNANIWTYFAHTGSFYNNGASSGSASTFGTGDLIQVSFDSDTGSLYFGKNGVWQNSGDPVAGTGYAYTGLSNVAVGTEGYSNAKVLANFGQQPFVYGPPE